MTITSTDSNPRSLYERIGGDAAIAAAVDGLYERIAADDGLTPYFADVDLTRLEAHQRAFIASALGGPDRYRGRELDVAHRRLAVTPSAFARVVDHLVDTLNALDVDPIVIADVTSAVRSLQPHVVST